STNVFVLHGLNFVRSRDLNAPLPGTNVFPYGDTTVRMMSETSGVVNQGGLNINPTFNFKKISIFGNYNLQYLKADFDGLPAKRYNLRAEWGRAFGDHGNRMNVRPTFPLPGKLIATTVSISSRAPVYNITTGLPDPSSAGAAVHRPALVDLPATPC